ncbi:MAG: hypothetical protein ACI4JM_08330, partial [Oscillospiraceae bacterium]
IAVSFYRYCPSFAEQQTKYVLRLSTSLTMLNNPYVQGYFNTNTQKSQGVDEIAIPFLPFLQVWLDC